MQTLFSILEVILVIVPALLAVAFTTVAERKTMASMQRRLGPNIVGYYGLLQAFADALTLLFSLLGYAVVPYGSGLFVADFSLGILYALVVSSLATYGILLAG